MKLGSAVVLLAILALAAILRVWGMDYGLPHPTARPDEERIVGRAMQILATGDFHPGDFTYPGLLKYLNSLALAIYVWFGKIVDATTAPSIFCSMSPSFARVFNIAFVAQ